MKHTHYTNFGLSIQPSIADQEGYIPYRDGYKDLPLDQWTMEEIWIAKQTLRVSVQNGTVDEFDAISRSIELQDAEQAFFRMAESE